ncbi:hypothetical protein HJC23_008439 [Cyclotella cryptica]|uniref:Uncharacterized protein n=1 Tax=Cyclotella cryptica TaxID=29204 RepID=A0ABD3NKE7_9STRA
MGMKSRPIVHRVIWMLSITNTIGGGVPDGWKMTDRFVGFRYEVLPSPLITNDIKITIRDKADELFCFGWAQDSPRQSIIGESRCTKSAGDDMKSFISSLATEPSGTMINGTVVFRDYPDTLIRLHFSHFKVLSKERNTCFHDQPHKCIHLYDETEDGIKFRDR